MTLAGRDDKHSAVFLKKTFPKTKKMPRKILNAKNLTMLIRISN
jgi:hypothetical protein